MIYSLKGTLIHRTPAYIVIECGGVGYKCTTSLMTIRSLPDVGKECMVYTHMVVREDAVELFGFSSNEERECFKMLTGVSGVGSKVGTALLSEFTPEQVAVCIASEDSKSLTKAAGVGNKLAQRIVLELKDKINKLNSSSGSSKLAGMSAGVPSLGNVKNAMDALSVLGYESSEIMPIISKFDSELKVEELIHLTLLELGKNKGA